MAGVPQGVVCAMDGLLLDAERLAKQAFRRNRCVRELRKLVLDAHIQSLPCCVIDCVVARRAVWVWRVS
jgi:hypothetical protein